MPDQFHVHHRKKIFHTHALHSMVDSDTCFQCRIVVHALLIIQTWLFSKLEAILSNTSTVCYGRLIWSKFGCYRSNYSFNWATTMKLIYRCLLHLFMPTSMVAWSTKICAKSGDHENGPSYYHIPVANIRPNLLNYLPDRAYFLHLLWSLSALIDIFSFRLLIRFLK